jgi:divalent metal cation (Fe/Co/Zn/Cd) transporter
VSTAPTAARREELHRRGLWLEWLCAYLSVALLAAVGLNAAFGWWWADPLGALAMLPVILWQGWETLGEAREGDDDDDD